ncbi:hypothetical protein SDC9_62329 [bioreactor metagenome]|uniref:Uncharacterized protein n=1 Tax=bioreactor metagenome TaxID=1076179 RepID=A0A644XID4_9ZZZZ
MGKYTKDELISELYKVENFQFFYKNRVIDFRGPRSGSEEKYTEIIAEWVIKHAGRFQTIVPIQCKNSYYSLGHDKIAETHNGTTEKHLAQKMYRQRKMPGVGSLLDFKVPLNDKQNGGAGEIDLLVFDEEKKILRILELKHPNAEDTMLHCVLEAYSYLKLVDKEKKLIRDFNSDGNANIPEDASIVACPFVFQHKCDKDGKPIEEDTTQYREMKVERPKLKRLMELLNVKPLFVEVTEDFYTASEL